MSHQGAEKKFIFGEEFDNAFISSMYEDDYAYISEVLTSSLDTISESWEELQQACNTDNLPVVRKLVHKLKPVFGFAGLTAHQQKAEQLEKDLSQSDGSPRDLCQHALSLITKGKNLIVAEDNRLKEYLEKQS